MNLIVTSITMADLTNKEARKVFFSSGKNLITSEKNHLGKSVIMKSIYYTLGAEVYYPNPIKRINMLTYIDFALDGNQYRICRLKWAFTLYCDGEFVASYSSVNSFQDALCQLFKLDIDLVGKDKVGTIVKCPPAFYFMPYYIDQENGWATNSFSFDRLTQFDMPQRKNSFFFHLGVFDSNFVEISKRQKANDRRIATLDKENEKYTTVIETLKAGIDDIQMSFDTTSLEHAISLRKNEIKILLEEIVKVRSNLIEAEDQLLQITHDKEVIEKYIKRKHPKMEDAESELMECPRCGMVFERTLAQKLEKAYLLESLHDDFTNIVERQVSLERSIAKLRKKFNEKQNRLKAYEETLTSDQESYNAYVKSKATNQLLKEYHEWIGANLIEIERLNQDSIGIKKRLREYNEDKTQANKTYLTHFGNLMVDLDIPKDQIDVDIEPGSSLFASGAYGPRCKIAQMLAFVETQKNLSPSTITFPLIIDSPNTLEQDSEHLNAVIRTLLTWNKTDNQVIVASIEGKQTASSIPGVHIISLSNSKNHLFNADEYEIYESEIAEMLIKF